MPGQKMATSTPSQKEAAKKRGAAPSTQPKAVVSQVSPYKAARPVEILALQRMVGNQAVRQLLARRGPPGGGVIQRLKDSNGKEITKEMVEAASIDHLEIWAKLDHEWDDEVYDLVEKRLAELKSAPKKTPPTPEVTSPVGEEVVTPPEPVPSVPVVPSAREVFEESL